MMRAIYAIVVLDLKRAWLERTRLVAGLVQTVALSFRAGCGLGCQLAIGRRGLSAIYFSGHDGAHHAFLRHVFGDQHCFRPADWIFQSDPRGPDSTVRDCVGKNLLRRRPGFCAGTVSPAICAAGRGAPGPSANSRNDRRDGVGPRWYFQRWESRWPRGLRPPPSSPS